MFATKSSMSFAKMTNANQQPISATNSHNLTKQQQDKLLAALNKVSEINIPKAISAMSGQVRLFLKLVKNFTHEQQQRSTELNYLLSQQDLQTIEHRAHSLKTYSAYIGAYNLSSQAAKLEADCNQQQFEKSQLDTVCLQLEQLLSQLTPICGIDKQQFAHHPAHYNQAEFTKLLKISIPLLNQGNAAVEDLLPQLCQMSQGTPYEQNITALITYVDEIEFEIAAQIAQEILTQVSNG